MPNPRLACCCGSSSPRCLASLMAEKGGANDGESMTRHELSPEWETFTCAKLQKHCAYNAATVRHCCCCKDDGEEEEEEDDDDEEEEEDEDEDEEEEEVVEVTNASTKFTPLSCKNGEAANVPYWLFSKLNRYFRSKTGSVNKRQSK